MGVFRFFLQLLLFFAGFGLLLAGIVLALLFFAGISFSLAIVVLLVLAVIALAVAILALPLRAVLFVLRKIAGALEAPKRKKRK